MKIQALSFSSRTRLRRMVDDRGFAGTLAAIGVTGATLARALGGLPLQGATVAVIEAALALQTDVTP